MIRKSSLRICIGFLSMNVWANEPVILSVPDKGIIPVGNDSLEIQVLNTGTVAAYNIKANLPEKWSNVVQNSSQCSVVEARQSCTLTLSSSEPYLAKIVTIAGEYTNAATIAIGFSIHDYLVYNIDKESRMASVIYPSNAKAAPWVYEFWNDYYLVGALSKTDGYGNTKKIYDLYEHDKWWNSARKTDPGAAINCMNLKEDGGGWYLPALRQMYQDHFGWGSVNTQYKFDESEDHTINRLAQLGFGNLMNYRYWTSTELDTERYRDYREPTAQGVYLAFINYEGKRYDHSGILVPISRSAKLVSRCVKNINY